jgi:hypothetical protein
LEVHPREANSVERNSDTEKQKWEIKLRGAIKKVIQEDLHITQHKEERQLLV